MLERGVEDDERIAEVIGLPGSRVRFAGDDRLIELLEYEQPVGRALRPSPNDPGAGHVALVVDDVDAALRRLRDHGFPSRSPSILLDDHDGRWKDARIVYVDDPDGYVIELIQRP